MHPLHFYLALAATPTDVAKEIYKNRLEEYLALQEEQELKEWKKPNAISAKPPIA